MGQSQRQSLLNALSFRAIDARYSTVKAAHAQTCKWLLSKPEYQEWLDASKGLDHHRLLWIKGKPGSGKSTLLKFAVEDAQNTRKGAVVIFFFFNARGEGLEKSTLGMYRSLLYQLLKNLPDLQAVLDRIKSNGLHDADSYTWQINDLQSVLTAAIENLGQRQVVCFIDALDEGEEDDIRKLVMFLETLGQRTRSSQINFHACLSSRHYPHISAENCIKLILERQEGHAQDIANYLSSELKAGSDNQSRTIKDEILRRASGIFLWVALVVPILNREYDHGRVHALRRRLNEIPDGLDKLFEDMLMRDKSYFEELILCLQWILYATRPLRREELYYAILSGTDEDGMTVLSPENVGLGHMEQFILSCSKGLAETTKSKLHTVQFIHESVREYLLGENGFNMLKSELGSAPSHERLKLCCCVYMKLDISDYLSPSTTLPVASTEEAKDLQRRVSARFPFLEYAVRNVLLHADSASEQGVSQETFIEDFNVGDWILLDNLFESYQIHRYTGNHRPSFLYISTRNNLRSLVRTQLLRGQYTADAVEAVLSDPKVTQDTISTFLMPTVPPIGADQTMLRATDDIDSQRHAIERIVTYRPKLSSSGHPLGWVASGGHDDIILLWLRAGGLPDSTDTRGRTLLSLAATSGQEAVVKLLLAEGSNVNFQDNEGCTPLSRAVNRGHEAVVKLLLADDHIDPDIRESGNSSTLSLAALNGHEQLVKLLLADERVDARAVDHPCQTPLSWAVIVGYEAVVKLLLVDGRTNPNFRDWGGRTPLSWAASTGHEPLVKLLLADGRVDPNIKDGRGQTPLTLAKFHRRKEVVRLLLADARIDPNIKGTEGKTPFPWTESMDWNP